MYANHAKGGVMVTEKNIYQSANLVIRKCGKRYNPMDYAYSQMERLYNKGDFEGATVWARIANAVADLMSDTADGTVH